MQIVLIQAEIEKAIRNYVNSIVKVAEGVDIVIDLKSTRGDTGFTANIDLVESGVERTAAPAPTPAPASKAAAAKAITESSDDLAVAAKKKSDPAATAEQAALKKEQEQLCDAAAVAKQATTVEPGEGITEPPFEPDVKEETQATTTAEPEANGQPAVPRKPLFGRTNAPLNA